MMSVLINSHKIALFVVIVIRPQAGKSKLMFSAGARIFPFFLDVSDPAIQCIREVK